MRLNHITYKSQIRRVPLQLKFQRNLHKIIFKKVQNMKSGLKNVNYMTKFHGLVSNAKTSKALKPI